MTTVEETDILVHAVLVSATYSRPRLGHGAQTASNREVLAALGWIKVDTLCDER
jgi:hypothetical protein